ncbi:4'-phosphopantetheinyl transferase family protein [Enhygromyxa salina]|uniref:4'-phosphopantetheinyl transferase psf-1 n=1 Tax=Enhygromyxa salina TaxID=215803 RepID=A0A2S9YNW3_9BACT|nr:4'-phosphopantetheinyl transferase superfamily protein [Enhygromyxa salina]PRQ06768.1 4'-phosphopantetheinyl transferase psf-1 [Enhygromyxa salina]
MIRPQLADAFTPRAGVLDLWEIDLARPISESDRDLLTVEETAKADRIIIESKQRQSYRARAELRRILACYLDADPGALCFAYGEQGKPALLPDPERGPAPLCFNLSHSGTVGLVGVIFGAADEQLGVDVEETRPSREFASIAESFFAPDEVEVFRRLPVAEHPAAFYRAWTRKEAYLKAIGTGLSFASSAFSISFGRGEPARLLRTTRAGDHPSRWRMIDVPCPAGYAAAACWSGPELELRHFFAPCSAPAPTSRATYSSAT